MAGRITDGQPAGAHAPSRKTDRTGQRRRGSFKPLEVSFNNMLTLAVPSPAEVYYVESGRFVFFLTNPTAAAVARGPRGTTGSQSAPAQWKSLPGTR